MRIGALVAAACAALAAAPPAAAAIPLVPCGDGWECGKVDRPGLELHVERLASPPSGRPPLVVLPGGPGQSSSAVRDTIRAIAGAVARGREVAIFDARGSGLSGLLRCRELERDPMRPAALTAAAARCARELGPARERFTTREAVEDLEAVREALGAPRIALLTFSYGSRAALAYAAQHPARVERIVLDSPVPAGGPDPLLRPTIRALRRVLASGSVDALASVVSALRSGPLQTTLGRRDGAAKKAVVRRGDLMRLLLAGDAEPHARAGLPAALASAVAGDAAPLARLAGRVRVPSREPAETFSAALNAATLCAETARPAGGQTPRRADLQPLDRPTVLAHELVALCARWPVPAARAPVARLPRRPLPTLIVSGDQDFRTPLEGATSLARRLQARLLVVRDAAHSPLTTDSSRCVARAVERFLSGRALAPTCVSRRRLALWPLVPHRLESLGAPPGLAGLPGRTLTGVAATLDDLIAAVLRPAQAGAVPWSGGGLRSGRYRITTAGIALTRYSAVRGLSLDGRLTQDLRGVLRVGGASAAKGMLAFGAGGELSGSLGGMAVRSRYIAPRMARR